MINYLVKIGFTMYEAKAYITLLENGALNGYELAKAANIPRSNAYSALESMVEKGYVYRINEKSVKFSAKSFSEIAEKLSNQLSNNITILNEMLPSRKEELSKFITVEGTENIVQKVIAMINNAKSKIIIDMHNKDLDKILDPLKTARQRGVVIYLIIVGYEERELEFEYICAHPEEEKEKRDINMVCDGTLAISAELGAKHCNGVFSQNRNFVNVVAEALAHDILLEEALKGCSNDHIKKVQALEKIFFM